MSEDPGAALRDQWLAEAEERQRKKSVKIGNKKVDKSTSMPTWEQDGVTYHINLTSGETHHVTRENPPRTQYYFVADAGVITGRMPTPKERGRSTKKVGKVKVQTKKSFDELPEDVQKYIRTNWFELIG